MDTFTILGTCDSVNDCDCCGRSGLKHTVALDNGFTVTYYGTTCAAKVTKRKAGYVARTAKRRRRFSECEECTGGKGYMGSHGRILCHECTDSYHRALLG